MELSFLDETNKKIVFEIRGESHTFCNALKQELYEDEHVKMATYTKKHPLVGHPVFTVETDGKVEPKRVLYDAANRTRKILAKLKTAVSRELK